MESLKRLVGQRRSRRRSCFGVAKIKCEDASERTSLVLDISEEGVRLYVGGFDIPDKFVLALEEGEDCESRYGVIWRRG